MSSATYHASFGSVLTKLPGTLLCHDVFSPHLLLPLFPVVGNISDPNWLTKAYHWLCWRDTWVAQKSATLLAKLHLLLQTEEPWKKQKIKPTMEFRLEDILWHVTTAREHWLVIMGTGAGRHHGQGLSGLQGILRGREILANDQQGPSTLGPHIELIQLDFPFLGSPSSGMPIFVHYLHMFDPFNIKGRKWPSEAAKTGHLQHA